MIKCKMSNVNAMHPKRVCHNFYPKLHGFYQFMHCPPMGSTNVLPFDRLQERLTIIFPLLQRKRLEWRRKLVSCVCKGHDCVWNVILLYITALMGTPKHYISSEPHNSCSSSRRTTNDLLLYVFHYFCLGVRSTESPSTSSKTLKSWKSQRLLLLPEAERVLHSETILTEQNGVSKSISAWRIERSQIGGS